MDVDVVQGRCLAQRCAVIIYLHMCGSDARII